MVDLKKIIKKGFDWYIEDTLRAVLVPIALITLIGGLWKVDDNLIKLLVIGFVFLLGYLAYLKAEGFVEKIQNCLEGLGIIKYKLEN